MDSLNPMTIILGVTCLGAFFGWLVGRRSESLSETFDSLPTALVAFGAQGGRAPRLIWRFEALDDSPHILEFYETTCTKAGWKVERRKNGLLLSMPGLSVALWSEPHGNAEQIIIPKLP